jgi:hypothetical protein
VTRPLAGFSAAVLNERLLTRFGPIGSGEMNLILMILRLVVSVLFPSRRDGLSLAARADGRLQHVPQSPWAWLLGDSSDGRAGGPGAGSGRRSAPKVRADSGPPQDDSAFPPPDSNGS